MAATGTNIALVVRGVVAAVMSLSGKWRKDGKTSIDAACFLFCMQSRESASKTESAEAGTGNPNSHLARPGQIQEPKRPDRGPPELGGSGKREKPAATDIKDDAG